MAKIKSQNTKPEIKLKRVLWGLGLRYRKHVKTLPGTPDIVFSKKQLAIFIDGEFWHGYQWEERKLKIKSNREFWIPKIERNMQRDALNNQLLKERGWTVIRFWSHEIMKDLGPCVNKILVILDEPYLEE